MDFVPVLKYINDFLDTGLSFGPNLTVINQILHVHNTCWASFELDQWFCSSNLVLACSGLVFGLV